MALLQQQQQQKQQQQEQQRPSILYLNRIITLFTHTNVHTYTKLLYRSVGRLVGWQAAGMVQSLMSCFTSILQLFIHFIKLFVSIFYLSLSFTHTQFLSLSRYILSHVNSSPDQSLHMSMTLNTVYLSACYHQGSLSSYDSNF